MKYTQNIKDAIRFAIATHEVDQKQKRKGKDIAYTTHPLTVGLILAQAGADEEVIMAGILHDTIEDSIEEKKVTTQTLAELFGSKVAELVDSVTEQNRVSSWKERKRVALEHISEFSNESVLLKSADVISNTTELLDDYAQEGESVWNRFNAKKEERLENTQNVINALLKQWPQSPLADDLKDMTENLARMNSSVENLYLDQEASKTRRIVYTACEDDEECGFFVEFQFPNCTFFFCKDHKTGFNLDLNGVGDNGVECKEHGKMERYDLLSEDNLCPSCRKNTLAILSSRIEGE